MNLGDRFDKNVFDRSFFPGGGAAAEMQSIFEAADPPSQSIEDFSKQQMRAMSLSSALVWVDQKDFTFGALDSIVVGMVDLDGDDEVGDEEEEIYNDLLGEVASALVALGGSKDNVGSFLDDENDEQGEILGKALSKKLDGVSTDDDELITKYVLGTNTILEAATRKVVRNGKIVLKKKRVKKYRMSAAQRQGLKKARRKSNTAAARRNRAKARRVRKQRGL